MVSPLPPDEAKLAELRAALTNPLVPAAARKAVLSELTTRLALTTLAKNAVGLLAERRRLPALPHIARALSRMTDERSGVVRATIASAAPLSESYAQRVQRQLEVVTGKRVVLARKQDPSLLAGVVVKVGDRVFDGSARARLAELRDELVGG